jgi:hypothetical protein
MRGRDLPRAAPGVGPGGVASSPSDKLRRMAWLGNGFDVPTRLGDGEGSA